MIKMFQGWQVGAIYRQAACVCRPVCVLLTSLVPVGLSFKPSVRIQSDPRASECQPIDLPVDVCPFLHVCGCQSGLSGCNGLQQLEITRN